MAGAAGEAIRGLPVLLVATMRPSEMPQWAEQSGASIMHLVRLQPDEIRRLVNTIAAEHKMPTSLVDAIVMRSDGIPIFAEELAHSLQAMGDASPGTADATAIPVTLNEILLARLDLLEHGRETAQLAAAIGRDIPLDLLIAVSPFGEAATRASIERLVEAASSSRATAVSATPSISATRCSATPPINCCCGATSCASTG